MFLSHLKVGRWTVQAGIVTVLPSGTQCASWQLVTEGALGLVVQDGD